MQGLTILTSAGLIVAGAVTTAAMVAGIEAANSQLINTQLMLRVVNPASIDLNKLSTVVEEALDQRLIFGQAAFIASSVMATFGIIAFLNMFFPVDEKNDKGYPLGKTGMILLLNTAAVVAAEIVLNEVLLDTVREGLMENHALFNSVFIGPVLAVAAVTLVGVITAAVGAAFAEESEGPDYTRHTSGGSYRAGGGYRAVDGYRPGDNGTTTSTTRGYY